MKRTLCVLVALAMTALGGSAKAENVPNKAFGERVADEISFVGEIKFDFENRVATVFSELGKSRSRPEIEKYEVSAAVEALAKLPGAQDDDTPVNFSEVYSSPLVKRLWNEVGTHAIDLNGNGQVDLVMRVWDREGKLCDRCYRNFDEYSKGKVMRSVELWGNPENKPNHVVFYEYDAEGNLVECRGDAFFGGTFLSAYTYHPNGQKKSKKSYSGNSLHPRRIEEWDEQGNETKSLGYGKLGAQLHSGMITFYDKEGRKIREEYFRHPVDLGLSCNIRVEEFNAAGERVRGYEDKGCDGTPEYCWDERSHRIRKCDSVGDLGESEFLRLK